MSNFWDMADGESAATGEKEYQSPTGGFKIIPDGSSVLAMIDEAGWETDDANNEFIKLRWSVLEPEEFANGKIAQKMWVTDDDPNAKDDKAATKKRDNAKKMLAAIDANAGGKLSRKAARPEDDDLMLALANKPMVITVKVWEMEGRDGKSMSGNWVCAVSPKTKGVNVTDAPVPAKRETKKPFDDGFDDDEIPF